MCPYLGGSTIGGSTVPVFSHSAFLTFEPTYVIKKACVARRTHDVNTSQINFDKAKRFDLVFTESFEKNIYPLYCCCFLYTSAIMRNCWLQSSGLVTWVVQVASTASLPMYMCCTSWRKGLCLEDFKQT